MFEPLEIDGLFLVRPKRHADERGWFSETFVADQFAEQGLDVRFVQDNQSWSTQRGVVRGLHLQVPPHAQAKLVRCSVGAILDVAVDLRKTSATYGQHVEVELSAQNGLQLYIPDGFAHGFCTLSDQALIDYKVSTRYAPQSERGILWNDPELAIDWPVDAGTAILSDKDEALAPLGSQDLHF